MINRKQLYTIQTSSRWKKVKKKRKKKKFFTTVIAELNVVQKQNIVW